jgi:hypothetical protein
VDAKETTAHINQIVKSIKLRNIEK